jgi:glycosyltransferase involved in cell wall biosynthesis
MDGLEWKRTKYSTPVRKFLKYAERLGVKYSDYLISDSIGIQKYLETKYNKRSIFIPYGAQLFSKPEFTKILNFNLLEYGYNMLIARLEPENSIEMILDGVVLSKIDTPFLVIGKHQTRYGNFLKRKYKEFNNILFWGSIYNLDILNNLRYFSNLYLHGHSVGGTNPSLLEAMASKALICANDNIFNKSVLQSDAFYFKNAEDVAEIIKKKSKNKHQWMISSNTNKIKNVYSWPKIVDQYLKHFESILKIKKGFIEIEDDQEQAIQNRRFMKAKWMR